MASLSEYLASVDGTGDNLDYVARHLLSDREDRERVQVELDHRFDSGAAQIAVIDRGGKQIWIRREGSKNGFKYLCGEGGNWSEPDDLIWILAMFQLARDMEAWRGGVAGELVRG